MRLADAETMLLRMSERRVVVVGDLFLDEYLVGRSERLSREAPVPVLAFTRRFSRPGGAANPARNIASLGATTIQAGVVGNDDAGRELKDSLTEAGIDAAAVVCDPTRPTTVKTRVVAEGVAVGQQVARIDRQSRAALGPEVKSELLQVLQSACSEADTLVASHYMSGVIDGEVCEAARRAAEPGKLFLAADAQGDLGLFEGFHLVRVGRGDAAAGLGRPLESEHDFRTAAVEIRRELGAEAVVLGRGPAGMSVADEMGYEVIPPANVSEVYDVAGAGDTVVALLALAMASGLPVRDGVELANHAAGLVVRRLGVAAPSRAEILAEVERAEQAS